MYNFDNPPSRNGSNAEKYTARSRLFGRQDVLPFWVADMEFATAPSVLDALAARMAHPVYGYTSVPKSLPVTISAWNSKRHGISFAPESLTLVTGVMSAVLATLSILSAPGDGIVVQTPLYPPLMQTVLGNHRLLLENQLTLSDGRYRMNFIELERMFTLHQPKVFLLCSPHNPVGRVWERDEIDYLVKLTSHYGVYLVSDEIHADIVFSPHRHISALSYAKEHGSRIMMLNSASKSFNIAGLNTAYAVIPDQTLRKMFRRQLQRMNLYGVNIFGMTALEAAYSGGEEWLEALMDYLSANRKYMRDRLTRELPDLDHYSPDGTYLYWLDFNSLGLSPAEIRMKLIDEAGVGLNDGITFSQSHAGFWRFNFAVPRSMLTEGLGRIIEAFGK